MTKTITLSLPGRRTRPVGSISASRTAASFPVAPRIARLLALAHRLEGLVRAREVSGYKELARLGQISEARLSQIILLSQLAPEIQECVLFFPGGAFLSEAELRAIARELSWAQQIKMFEERLSLVRSHFEPARLHG
jgi:hypothetical protein